MIRLQSIVITLLGVFVGVNPIKAQLENQEYSIYFGAQITLNYKLGKQAFRENFPGIKTFVGFNSFSELKLSNSLRGSLNFGSSITLYNKSLGNSLNLGFQDNQIDWTSNIALGVLWGGKDDIKSLQSINNTPFYNLRHKSKNAVQIGTNFIMNNYKRHQTNGMFSMTFDRFSMTYYNDGGPFFSQLGLGDNFDRYWTGGVLLYLHDKKMEGDSVVATFNRLEVTFDQFTGYRPQMYEITTIFGADIQDYDLFQQFGRQDSTLNYSVVPKDKVGYDFNASRYSVNYNFDESIGASLGIIGSLRDLKREKYFALQDIIHILTEVPIHPNKDTNRLSLGFNYKSRLWNQ